MSVMPAFAADTKIDTVKLTFPMTRHLPAETGYWFDPCKRWYIQLLWQSPPSIPMQMTRYLDGRRHIQIKVNFTQKDGYRFSYTSKSHFKLSGCNAEFKKAKDLRQRRLHWSDSPVKTHRWKTGRNTSNWNGMTLLQNGTPLTVQKAMIKLLRDEKTVTTVKLNDLHSPFNKKHSLGRAIAT